MTDRELAVRDACVIAGEANVTAAQTKSVRVDMSMVCSQLGSD